MRSFILNEIGSIARVRYPRVAGLLTEDGCPMSPFQSVRLTTETPFLIEGRGNTALFVRLLAGKHENRLAALSQKDLDLEWVVHQPEGLLVA